MSNQNITEEEFVDYMYSEIAEEEKKHFDEMFRVNERIMKAIESTIGKGFAKDLRLLIEDFNCDGTWELVDSTISKYVGYQYEDFGCITGVWVDQWSTGTEGDSYAGYVYVKLKNRLFLKMGWSC
jgi:hypothetical protein